MFPAGLLYVHLTLANKNRIPVWGWLLLIPGCIHLLEMMPFYLLSNATKIDYLKQLTRDPMKGFSNGEGWLPQYAHNLMRGIIGSCCGIAAFYLIFRAKKNQPTILGQFPGLTRWLMIFSCMLLIFGLALFLTFINVENWTSHQIQSRLLTYSFSLSLIVTASYLMLNPGYLYGMPRIEPGTNDSTNKVIETVLPSTSSDSDKVDQGLTSYHEKLLCEIRNFIDIHKPYLQPNYQIHDLAKDTGIPKHHISYILNNILQMRFTEFIHRYRLLHIEHSLEKEGSIHSLEGMAKSAGFASRATFHRVVTQLTGQTPASYFLKKQKQTK